MSTVNESKKADIEAIKLVHELEAEAIFSGDLQGYLDILMDDAVVMPPGMHALNGKAEIRSWFQDLRAHFEVELDASSEEIIVFGDWAFERFHFNWTLTPSSGGKPIPDEGNGIHIFHRQPGGKWKIARDNWNSIKQQKSV